MPEVGTASTTHGVPSTFFLNRRHQIVAVVVGGGTLWEFERAYRKALKSP